MSENSFGVMEHACYTEPWPLLPPTPSYSPTHLPKCQCLLFRSSLFPATWLSQPQVGRAYLYQSLLLLQEGLGGGSDCG